MNSRAMSNLAVAGFVLLGALAVGMRYSARLEEQAAREDSRWRLSYDVQFESGPEGAGVRLWMPVETRHIRVLKHEWHSDGLTERIVRREMQLTTGRARNYNPRAYFELHLSPRGIGPRRPPLETLSGEARLRYLRHEPSVIPKDSPVVRRVAQQVPEEAGETDAERVQWIFDFCRAQIDSPAEATDDAEAAIETREGSPLARARAMAAICRAIRIPARLVTGFEVREQPVAEPRVWVEVFLNQSWVPFDPVYGYTQSMPIDYVPVRHGGDQLYSASGTVSLTASYTMTRILSPARALRGDVRHPTQILDLTRLSVSFHPIMKLLLLLPFAALITAVIRNVVGIQTYGTFAPALLAMSFLFADWETGLMILIVVVATGLVGRTFLERLRLLMVPRLSIILTTVILCVVFGVSLLEYLILEPARPQAVLLPLVILTIMIERFYVTSEEDGMMYSLQLALGTLAVAVLCYLVLVWEYIGNQVLVYPEVHFFTIAAFIVLGRYAGYRLTELWRFRDMAEGPETGR